MLDEIGVCESDGCTDQWELMEECACADGMHGRATTDDKKGAQDSNGAILQNGDDVVLIKDLPLRGTSKTLKRGTKAKNIRLTDSPEEVDCKVDGMEIVLRTEFVRKV